jgi:hypothetical protein
MIAIAAVVVVIIVIIGLGFSGLIPGFKLGGSSPSGPSGPKFVITFTETGLPSGTSWSVTLAGSLSTSTTTTITFSEQNGSYSYSVGSVPGYLANPASGTVTVTGVPVSQGIGFKAGYAVTFTESTLPSGTMWSATLNGSTLSSTTGSIVFTEANGMYSYSIPTLSGYTASPASGSVTVSGVAQSVPITFTPVPRGEYAVTFTESGLTAGTNWSVTLGGTLGYSTTTMIAFNEKNNTYPYTVGAVSGYTATPSSGNVVVSGGPASATIMFTTSGPSLGGPQYAVTFDQTGLPATDLWTAGAAVTTDFLLDYGETSAGASIEFSAPDGTYYWDASTNAVAANGLPYQEVQSSLEFNVTGAPLTIPVSFLPTYTVNFTETGLTVGASWNVTVNGTTTCYATAPNNCTFSSTWTNGMYPYVVAALGYTPSPASGTVTVSGSNVSQPISFTTLTTYSVEFTETGVASGHDWYVYLDGVPNSGIAPGNIVFSGFPNGVYPFYDVSAVGHYSASPSTGSVTVASGPALQAIVFTAISTYTVTFSESGLISGTGWDVELNGSYGSATAPATIPLTAPAGYNSWAASATGYNNEYGHVTVTSGTNSVTVIFTAIPPPPTTYNVTFNETGLPSYDEWSVYMINNGLDTSCSNVTAAGANMSCWVPDGYYSWVAGAEFSPNYTASPTSGYLTETGTTIIVDVTYVNTTALNDYLALFVEGSYWDFGLGGIPNGSTWSVTVGGVTQSSQGMFIYFLEPNGTTKAFTVTPPAGYVVVPSSGNITGYVQTYQGSYDLYYYATVAVVFAADPPVHASASFVESSLSGAPHGFAIAATRDDA